MAELTLTAAQNGARFTVRVGDVIIVHLSENSAAGYRWTVSALDPTRLTVEEPRYQPTNTGVGSAGTAVWQLQAMRAGPTRVELKKSRPWEPADSASERFAFDLVIVE